MIIYNSLWYKLNVKDQKSINFLIMYAQTERNIKGFNFIECSLGTLLRVGIVLVLVYHAFNTNFYYFNFCL